MRVFNHISDYESQKPSVLTIGTFDGVHIGHKKIIEKVIKTAEKEDLSSVILTFFPHPRMVLQGDSDIKLLNTINEKIDLLQEIGIENLVIHPFDETFSRLTAEEFVKTILVDRFNIQKIIIGHDHRFGRNRTANIDDLITYGEQYGFEVEQISVQEINEISVSSTKIRQALIEGNMTLANDYLGYDYFLTGTVIHGKQLGRTINFPTANIEIQENYKLIPLNGVYIVKSTIENKLVYGMMNIGLNPTVNGQKRSIEVHFLDFDADLYDTEIRVSVLSRIRSEQKFESFNLLKEQLGKDKQMTISYLNHL